MNTLLSHRSSNATGVVCGLSFGSLSLVGQFVRGLFGYVPAIDPCLPEDRSEDPSSESKPKQA